MGRFNGGASQADMAIISGMGTRKFSLGAPALPSFTTVTLEDPYVQAWVTMSVPDVGVITTLCSAHSNLRGYLSRAGLGLRAHALCTQSPG